MTNLVKGLTNETKFLSKLVWRETLQTPHISLY